MSLNTCVLIGRLTKDPDLRTTPDGTIVTNFTVAVDRKFKNKQGEKEADFINIVTWRGLAENCGKYLSKGKMAAVSGSLQIRNYTDKEGNKKYITEVIADDVQFLSPKNEVQEREPGEETERFTDYEGDSGELPF